MQPFNEIPHIDLSPLFNGSTDSLLALSKQVKSIYSEIGFAYVINHRFPEILMSSVFEAADDFHTLPLSEKMKIKQNQFFRGYMPLNSSILKISTLGEAVKHNQSAAFIMAHEVEEDNVDYINQINLAGPNQWPESLPQFKNIM